MPEDIISVQISRGIHDRLKRRAAMLRQKLRYTTEDAITLGLSKQKPAKGEQK